MLRKVNAWQSTHVRIGEFSIMGDFSQRISGKIHCELDPVRSLESNAMTHMCFLLQLPLQLPLLLWPLPLGLAALLVAMTAHSI